MLHCSDERRRRSVRAKEGWNGLDFIEVHQTQKSLTVYFLGKAPEGIGKEHIVIEGGQSPQYHVSVVATDLRHGEEPDLDDRLLVHVGHPGDFSTYTLRLVGLERIDPRYDRVTFSFKAHCPSDLDCAAAPPCPEPQYPKPHIDYLAKDYATFRQLVLDRLSLIMPDWRERHVPDLGITLVEVLAYAADYLSYYQDAVATEAYLDTARRRPSVRRHVRLVDYTLSEGCNARAFLRLEAGRDLNLDAGEVFFITALNGAPPIGGRSAAPAKDLEGIASDSYEVFEPLLPGDSMRLWEANNKLHFYTWGDRECCLGKGSVSATLRGKLAGGAGRPKPDPASQVGKSYQGGEPGGSGGIHLRPGDLLIFEEVIGPRTGSHADADPNRRHPVRLTKVVPAQDPLTGDDIIEIEWAGDDALPFELCLSAIGPAPECKFIDDVTVAWGNVILVDHGRRLPPEVLGEVPLGSSETKCLCEGQPGEIKTVPGRYRPRLSRSPLTFAQPLSAISSPEEPPSAAALLRQDPRRALPSIWLDSIPPAIDGTGPAYEWGESGSEVVTTRWMPRSDLIGSGPDDPHFVVEMEEDGVANIRFGDNELGEQPRAGESFRAWYRIGNGPAGNVGAGAIALLIHARSDLGNDILQVSNPLPAAGGARPEPMAEAKLNAPYAFRIGTHALQRAIIAADYAAIAERDKRVQRAGAQLIWTGSWNEADVAVDPFARAADETALLTAALEKELDKFRRAGHDLHVKPAEPVPIDLALRVCVSPSHLRGHVKAALLDAFSNRLLPGGALGYFHPDRLACGDDLFVSRIVAVAQAVPGVASMSVTKLQRQFEAANRELENGVLPIGDFEVAQLDNDPNHPGHGRLEIELIGGR